MLNKTLYRFSIYSNIYQLPSKSLFNCNRVITDVDIEYIINNHFRCLFFY
mgnify:FL=1|jgi:hypothetical protein